MDLTTVRNPYDYWDPVSEEDLFFGRKDELDEVTYSLKEVGKGARPCSLAIIGERASGKTSFLNMIAARAEQAGFCVVRLALDSGDTRNDIQFFFKLFDAILMAACDRGAFGGLAGRTYGAYRDMVDGYQTTEDDGLRTFIFPMQYARAMSTGRCDTALSDTGFARDMQAIQAELGSCIVVLLDECDVLAGSRPHLEKLRNILMDSSGYMLVLSATPAFFPAMDSVFSPIARQFRRIQLRPWTDHESTRTCIVNSLEAIGIEDPDTLFDSKDIANVLEIHELSGGSPYETQLVCHYMFRRVQDQKTARMELTLDVLDDVRRHLESTQDVSAKPVISAVRRLRRESLEALDALCSCSGHANFDQIWFLRYALGRRPKEDAASLRSALESLVESGVIELRDGTIFFAGDHFDRIYCKYLAKSRNVPLSIVEMPYDLCLIVLLDAAVRSACPGIQPLLKFPYYGPLEPDAKQVADALAADAAAGLPDPFEDTAPLASALYEANLDFAADDAYDLGSVTLRTPWAVIRRSYRPASPPDGGVPSLKEFMSGTTILATRAEELGGSLDVELDTIPVLPIAHLAETIQRSNNQRMKKLIGLEHERRLCSTYLESGDLDTAIMHGRLALDLAPSATDLNNLAYLYLVSRRLDEAKDALERCLPAAADGEPVRSGALPSYNRALLLAMKGHLEDAEEELRGAIRICEQLSVSKRKCICLLRLRAIESKSAVDTDEVRDVDLLETARESLAVLREVIEPPSALPKGGPSPG